MAPAAKTGKAPKWRTPAFVAVSLVMALALWNSGGSTVPAVSQASTVPAVSQVLAPVELPSPKRAVSQVSAPLEPLKSAVTESKEDAASEREEDVAAPAAQVDTEAKEAEEGAETEEKAEAKEQSQEKEIEVAEAKSPSVTPEGFSDDVKEAEKAKPTEAAEAPRSEPVGEADGDQATPAAAEQTAADVSSGPKNGRREAFVFQAFNQVKPHSAFATSLYVAAYSIRKTGSTRRIIVQLTDDSVLDADALEALKIEIVKVDYIPMDESLCIDGKVPQAKQRLLKAGFTMLRVFGQAGFDSLLYLDSDLIVVSSVDHLFDLVGDGDASQTYPCALTPVGDMQCRRQGSEGSTPKANVGFFLVRPSQELFKSALERITHPYKCGVGSQDMLKAWFRQQFGVSNLVVEYQKLSQLDADLGASGQPTSSTNGPVAKLPATPPISGPAWSMGVTAFHGVDVEEAKAARRVLMQKRKASLKFHNMHGRKHCACVALKYNCKMDKDSLGHCAGDSGAEAKLPGAAGRSVVVRHWSGETKPWQHWWDDRAKVPIRRLSKGQKEGVLLWWKYKREMDQFVGDYVAKKR